MSDVEQGGTFIKDGMRYARAGTSVFTGSNAGMSKTFKEQTCLGPVTWALEEECGGPRTPALDVEAEVSEAV